MAAGASPFFDDAGDARVQCDGLVKNSRVVLLNEAKLHFHEEDARKLKNVTAAALESILARPAVFTSAPAGVIEALRGLEVVLVASSPSFSEKAEAACKAAGIHLLRKDGSGFACTLHGVGS